MLIIDINALNETVMHLFSRRILIMSNSVLYKNLTVTGVGG